MDGLYVVTETFHIIQVCVYSIKTLYTSCTGCDDHVLACTHQFKTGTGNVCL